MTRRESKRSSGSSWDARQERGSRLALRFVVWAIRSLGYYRLRVLLAPISVYYCLFAGPARRASREYLAKIAVAQGRPRRIGLRDIYRHIYTFAEVILDRVSLWCESLEGFHVEIHGREHMESLVENRSGAFLIGAHIGSFDVLRVVAREANIPVSVIMYSVNAKQINDAFQTLDPEANLRVIELDPSSRLAGLEVRKCLERGEFVAVLGDRVPSAQKSRIAFADFLGEPAAFPQGPVLLPILVQVPLILTMAIRRGPRSYDVYLEPLAGAEAVPKQRRDEAVQERVELFAARLEHYCMKDPLQWFNFYDFWEERDDV